MQCIFLNLYYKYVLSQFVTQPTRFSTAARNGSLLDLVFCNDRNFVYNTYVNAPFGTSDHVTTLNVVRHIQHDSTLILMLIHSISRMLTGQICQLYCIDYFSLF